MKNLRKKLTPNSPLSPRVAIVAMISLVVLVLGIVNDDFHFHISPKGEVQIDAKK